VIDLRRIQLLLPFVFIAFMSVCGAQDGKDAGQGDLAIRVSVNLVQIDVSVADQRGVPIRGLSKSDFEVFLDGKPENIKSFLEVRIPPGEPAPVRADGHQAQAAGQTARPVRPEQITRAVAIFVDDISLSAQTVPQVRRGLERIIQRDVGVGDLVAIVRASAGLGALQDFSTDKGMLLAAVSHIQWRPSGRGQMTPYDEVGVDRTSELMRLGVTPNSVFGFQEEENYREQTYTFAVLDSLQRVVAGMAGMPGRKSVVILSDRLPMSLREITQGPGQGRAPVQVSGSDAILEKLRASVDQAARNGVVINVIDTRGLASLRMGAGEILASPGGVLAPVAGGQLETSNAGPGAGSATGPASTSADVVWATTADLRESHDTRQAGGQFLAHETGGLMIPESNDIAASVERVFDAMGSYYLVGFEPPQDAFELASNGHPVFRHIIVRVKRTGAHVRTRSGFYGTTENPEALRKPSAELRLANSLKSPFGSSGLDIDLRSSFLGARKSEWVTLVSLWVDAHHLTLEGPTNNRSGIVHLIVRVFGVDGALLEGGIDEWLRISLDEKGYQLAMKNGLVYSTSIVIKKPGPYQIRAAVLDRESGRVGSASQFLVLPKPDPHRILLSGIVFTGMLSKEDDITPARTPRSFRPGQTVPFTFEIMGDLGNKTFIAGTRLYRDGTLVAESPPHPVDIANKTLHGSIFAKSEVKIPEVAAPGHDELQIFVREGGTGANKSAVQWTELDVEAAER
jgi:VWFA-related protein